jgi:hypothetical protein
MIFAAVNAYYQNSIAEWWIYSYPISINNRYLVCISCDPKDFAGLLTNSKQTIKSFIGSRTTDAQNGMILWQ